MRLRKTWGVVLAVVGIGAVWWNQPYFGYSLCRTKGIMHETDFVEEIRPIFLAQLDKKLEWDVENRTIEERIDPTEARDAVNTIIDAFVECVADLGLRRCRYVGSGEEAYVMHDQEHNDFVRNNRELFKHIDEDLPGFSNAIILFWPFHF